MITALKQTSKAMIETIFTAWTNIVSVDFIMLVFGWYVVHAFFATIFDRFF